MAWFRLHPQFGGLPGREAYAAFGRRDIPGILAALTDDMDWRFQASPSTGIPYGGKFTGKKAVEDWFATLPRSDEIQQFGGGKISRWIGTADTAARQAAAK